MKKFLNKHKLKFILILSLILISGGVYLLLKTDSENVKAEIMGLLFEAGIISGLLGLFFKLRDNKKKQELKNIIIAYLRLVLWFSKRNSSTNKLNDINFDKEITLIKYDIENKRPFSDSKMNIIRTAIKSLQSNFNYLVNIATQINPIHLQCLLGINESLKGMMDSEDDIKWFQESNLEFFESCKEFENLLID